jgi:hypothetical protein
MATGAAATAAALVTEAIRSALRMRRRREDRTLVVFQRPQPCLNVSRMLFAPLWREIEVSQDKCRANSATSSFRECRLSDYAAPT